MKKTHKHIVETLQSHLDVLKGEYLQAVINKIKNIGPKIEMCDNTGCILTRDCDQNYLMKVV